MDLKFKKRVATLINKSDSLLSNSNREAAFKERDCILDSAYPQGKTKFSQSFETIKVYNLHAQCKNLIHETKLLLQASSSEVSSEDEVKKELEHLLKKLTEEEKKYKKICGDLRCHIRSINKLDKKIIESQAKIQIEKYNNHVHEKLFLKSKTDIDEQLPIISYPQKQTWGQLENNLELITAVHDLNSPGYAETQVSKLLNPDNNCFYSEINNNDIKSFGGELQYLASARLFENANSEDRALAIIEGKRIPTFPHLPIYYFHEDQLVSEVMKLLMHIELYPENKNLWLGTGTDVIAWKKKYPGKGIYLNCDDSNYSWGLNRAYMRIAGKLGYDLVFIQRQFPNIQNAIMSENPTSVLIELVRQTRSGYDADSMYHHDANPTCTASEILALLEMGFKPRIDSEGLIRLRLRSMNTLTLEKTFFWRVTGIRPTRSHSAEPSYSLDRGDRSLNEVKRIFETPKQTQEVVLAAAIDRDRVNAYFCPEEVVGNEVNEDLSDFHDIKNHVKELREKMKKIIDTKGKFLKTNKPDILTSLGSCYGDLGKIDSLTQDCLINQTDRQKEKNKITLAEAEKVMIHCHTYFTIIEKFKLNALNAKAIESLKKIKYILSEFGMTPMQLAKCDASLKDLPILLDQNTEEVKFNTEQANSAINMQKKIYKSAMNAAEEINKSIAKSKGQRCPL